MNKTVTKLLALICIINPDLEDKLIEKLYENNVRGINIVLGQGVRKFHLLDLSDNHKTVVISFIKAENEENIMQLLKNENFVGQERGIAFTINVDAAAGGRSIFNFYDKIQSFIKEETGEPEKSLTDKEQDITKTEKSLTDKTKLVEDESEKKEFKNEDR